MKVLKSRSGSSTCRSRPAVTSQKEKNNIKEEKPKNSKSKV
jgi:hypothetical protein